MVAIDPPNTCTSRIGKYCGWMAGESRPRAGLKLRYRPGSRMRKIPTTSARTTIAMPTRRRRRRTGRLGRVPWPSPAGPADPGASDGGSAVDGGALAVMGTSVWPLAEVRYPRFM